MHPLVRVPGAILEKFLGMEPESELSDMKMVREG